MNMKNEMFYEFSNFKMTNIMYVHKVYGVNMNVHQVEPYTRTQQELFESWGIDFISGDLWSYPARYAAGYYGNPLSKRNEDAPGIRCKCLY